MAGCTGFIGEGPWGVSEGEASVSHDRRSGINAGIRDGGGGDGGRRGEGGRVGIAWVEGVVDDTPYGSGARASVLTGEQQFLGIDNLRHIARVGVPVDVRPGGNLTKELTYENHSSAQKVHVAVRGKAVADVASGRAIVSRRNRRGRYQGSGCHQSG